MPLQACGALGLFISPGLSFASTDRGASAVIGQVGAAPSWLGPLLPTTSIAADASLVIGFH
jgi:hypothetical protein